MLAPSSDCDEDALLSLGRGDHAELALTEVDLSLQRSDLVRLLGDTREVSLPDERRDEPEHLIGPRLDRHPAALADQLVNPLAKRLDPVLDPVQVVAEDPSHLIHPALRPVPPAFQRLVGLHVSSFPRGHGTHAPDTEAGTFVPPLPVRSD